MVTAFPHSGWHRADCGDATVFWHVEPEGSPGFASHGHCDTGSFCLFVRGTPLLVDPGRLNYRDDDALGFYGMSARAHNNVLVDDYEPFVYWRRSRFPDFFRRRRVELDAVETVEGIVVTLRHDGFSRTGPFPQLLTRRFHLQPDRLIIEDRLDSPSEHVVSTYFQWAPDVRVSVDLEPGSFRVVSDAVGPDGSFLITPLTADGRDGIDTHVARGVSSPPSGWYSPEYGLKTETSTLVCRSRMRPHACRYEITWCQSS